MIPTYARNAVSTTLGSVLTDIFSSIASKGIDYIGSTYQSAYSNGLARIDLLKVQSVAVSWSTSSAGRVKQKIPASLIAGGSGYLAMFASRFRVLSTARFGSTDYNQLVRNKIQSVDSLESMLSLYYTWFWWNTDSRQDFSSVADDFRSLTVGILGGALNDSGLSSRIYGAPVAPAPVAPVVIPIGGTKSTFSTASFSGPIIVILGIGAALFFLKR